jgi:hypothetical protein
MRILSLSLFALSLTAFVGCKAIDAMDNTETMKNDLAGMKNTTSGMAQTTGDMKDTMQGMDKTTNELERKAAVGIGLEAIGKVENQQEFAPPSKALLAGAKLIAEHMTTSELLKFFQVGLREVRKTSPKDIEMDRSAVGGYPARYVHDFNLRKQVQIVTLQAIAGQIPQKNWDYVRDEETGELMKDAKTGELMKKRYPVSIESIIRTQFHGRGGAQSNAAKQLLMLRAMFISNYTLSENVFAVDEQLDNPEKVQNAFLYAKYLQYIADFSKVLEEKEEKRRKEKNQGEQTEPKPKQISFFIGTNVFLPPVIPAEKGAGEEGCVTPEEMRSNPVCKATLGNPFTFSEELDEQLAKPWFKKVARRIDSELPTEFSAGSSPYAREIAETKEECLRQIAEPGQN